MPKVVLKSEVATAPDLLWRAIREFGALDRWNPRVHALDSEGDAIGSTRKVEVEGVGVFVERLERRDDSERSYGYAIVESPLPISKGAVEVRVRDNGDATATVEWASSFESGELSEFQAVKTFQQLYQGTLDNLGLHVGGQQTDS